jgi:hypothetical protein
MPLPGTIQGDLEQVDAEAHQFVSTAWSRYQALVVMLEETCNDG